MSEDRTAPESGAARKPYQKVLDDSYYGLLGVHPSASMRDIRQAYRDLSKLYHPDTTKLPTAIATARFQQLNEAYATLSNPERRGVYDRKIGYSSVPVIQPLPNLNTPAKQPRKYQSSSAYLDPTDRPLSPGELFALFIMGVTLVGCLCLAIMVGLTRGEALLQTQMVQNETGLPLIQTAPVSDPVPVRSTDFLDKTKLSPEPAIAVPDQTKASFQPPASGVPAQVPVEAPVPATFPPESLPDAPQKAAS
ncbi:J domain-containing protein [Leptodesmis sichuanensis]|uniref:J domain-containing protein n=1 Tax=Leptodesmis sichuanensis TaxID=2906798 RepID=UPI001F2561A8